MGSYSVFFKRKGLSAFFNRGGGDLTPPVRRRIILVKEPNARIAERFNYGREQCCGLKSGGLFRHGSETVLVQDASGRLPSSSTSVSASAPNAARRAVCTTAGVLHQPKTAESVVRLAASSGVGCCGFRAAGGAATGVSAPCPSRPVDAAD